MTFPRLCAVFLAIGGCVWASLLGSLVVGLFIAAPEGGPLTALICAPGFFAWYGYIRRAFGRFLLGRAYCVWLVSIIVNLGYLSPSFFIGFSTGFSTTNSLFELTVIGWLVIAIVLSILAWLRESGEPEFKKTSPQPAKVSDEEFKRLLDEHRRNV